MSSDVRNSLKVGNILQKDTLCMKMQKSGYQEFDFSGTLTLRFDFLTGSIYCKWDSKVVI